MISEWRGSFTQKSSEIGIRVFHGFRWIRRPEDFASGQQFSFSIEIGFCLELLSRGNLRKKWRVSIEACVAWRMGRCCWRTTCCGVVRLPFVILLTFFVYYQTHGIIHPFEILFFFRHAQACVRRGASPSRTLNQFRCTPSVAGALPSLDSQFSSLSTVFLVLCSNLFRMAQTKRRATKRWLWRLVPTAWCFWLVTQEVRGPKRTRDLTISRL